MQKLNNDQIHGKLMILQLALAVLSLTELLELSSNNDPQSVWNPANPARIHNPS